MNVGTVLLITILWLFSVPTPSGWAKDEPMTDDEVIVKTEGAHHLLLPKDWPVEQKDGRVAPIAIEEYLSLKFGQVKEKFNDTEQSLAALAQRIAKLEQENKTLVKRIRLLEERLNAKEVTDGHSTQTP